jgi:spore maturation protein CgeB
MQHPVAAAIHFPIDALTPEESARYGCDVAVIGAADADRVALVQPLLWSELRTHLYGALWDRYASTRRHHHGIVFDRALRAAVAGAKVHICIGRAANRDGHAMRSFELPAMGACLRVEDTSEHREIFGDDDVCVSYYQDLEDLVVQARPLCADATRRARLAAAAHATICDGTNTYAARLSTMLFDTPSRFSG